MNPPSAREAARARGGEFLRFGAVGVAGFVVDTATLTLALNIPFLNLYSGRAISYLVAATTTWTLNRRFTFTGISRDGRKRPVAAQWLRFLGANAVGGVVNYAVYAAIVTYTAIGAVWPVLGVAAGSVAGLGFNFTASKFWVFKA